MKTLSHYIRPHSLLILFFTVLIGLSGCTATVPQQSNDIDKKELAMRLQSCSSFINAANKQANNSADKKAQEILNKAQYLAQNAKDDFNHEKYKDALNKVNEAYRLGLTAWGNLTDDLPKPPG